MNKRSIMIAGTTGLVGRALLNNALLDASISVVHSISRRPLGVTHAKLHTHVVDFTDLPELPAVDEVYLAIGTTIKVAGSQAAFKAVDFDMNLAVAKAALAVGAKRVGVVSSMGANAQSRVFYTRVKGELEAAISALGFEYCVFARPSFLMGDRQALDQPKRLGERVGLACFNLLKPLVPRNYRPVAADDVANTLLRALAVVPQNVAANTVKGHRVLLSGDLHR